jgi:hypothetical protein
MSRKEIRVSLLVCVFALIIVALGVLSIASPGEAIAGSETAMFKRIVLLERRVAKLESRLDRMQKTTSRAGTPYHITEERVRSSGNQLGYGQFNAPFSQQWHVPRSYRRTTKSYNRTYHPRQADRDEYEKLHGGDKIVYDKGKKAHVE